MKSILLLLIFVCTCAANPVPTIDRKSVTKEHVDYLNRKLGPLPYNGPNQKLVASILSECFEDIRLTEPAMSGVHFPFRQDLYEDITYQGGQTKRDGSTWYLAFGGTDLISDYGVVYVYSFKEKKIIEKFYFGGS